MSDFESEHDTDSETEETRPRPSVSGVNVDSTEVIDGSSKDQNNEVSNIPRVSSKESEDPVDKEDETRTAPSSEEVSDITADFLAELKQAGNKTGVAQKVEVEPWKLYLQQQETPASYTFEDPNDGTVYEFDAEKRAWFPKVDEDFIAAYQANYGFTETGEPLPPEELIKREEEANAVEKAKSENQQTTGQKRKAEEPGWFDIDPNKNHNVYVSGLPIDITEEEFAELMGKCGIIMEDPETGKLKVRLYKDQNGKNKGDGRCCYLRGESIPLALQLLDESDYRGHVINVEQAIFQQKGNFNPNLKPKKKKKKKKKQAGQEKLLDWVERDNKRSKFDRIVILKHMFDEKEFEREPQLIIELREEIASECEKFGIVRKVLIFDRNPDGICSILFQEPEMADACVAALNERWFGGRKINAETYDGVTDYQVKETDAERDKRIKDWEDFLAHEQLENEKQETEKEAATS